MRVSHDQLFKEVCLAFPEDLVTLTLPYLAGQIDLSALDFEPSRERFDDVLRDRRWFPDLVSEARGRADPKQDALAHVEIEYKYRSAKVATLDRYNRVLTEGTELSVHTAVIYLHGGKPGVTKREEKEVSFGKVLRTFHYTSLGLAKAPAIGFLEREERLAWAFAVLMRPTGFASRGELAIACVRRILGDRALDEERRRKLLNFVQTYVKLDDKTAPEYEALLRESENRETNEMFMTWIDEVKEEGRQEERQKTIDGVEKLRGVVIRLVAQRFGKLSKGTRRAIAAITSLDELAELANRVLTADSLEELKIG